MAVTRPALPSIEQLPQTALRTLSSTVSQFLLPNTHGGQHDRSSSSNLDPHRWQLETLTFLLSVDEFDEMASSKLENIGWEDFIMVHKT